MWLQSLLICRPKTRSISRWTFSPLMSFLDKSLGLQVPRIHDPKEEILGLWQIFPPTDASPTCIFPVIAASTFYS